MCIFRKSISNQFVSRSERPPTLPGLSKHTIFVHKSNYMGRSSGQIKNMEFWCILPIQRIYKMLCKISPRIISEKWIVLGFLTPSNLNYILLTCISEHFSRCFGGKLLTYLEKPYVWLGKRDFVSVVKNWK